MVEVILVLIIIVWTYLVFKLLQGIQNKTQNILIEEQKKQNECTHRYSVFRERGFGARAGLYCSNCGKEVYDE